MIRLSIFLITLLTQVAFARDYMIYSIAHEVPMGYEKEILKKNFFVNIGEAQGVREGTTLDVFRQISVADPYQSKQRYDYRVKVGELSVIHSEGEVAIAAIKSIRNKDEDPLFEIENFMVGDLVSVHVK